MHLQTTSHQKLITRQGQTAVLVTLFILIIAQTGFCIYIFIQQGASTEETAKKMEKYERDLRTAKNNIDDLTEKIRSQKDSLNEQTEIISHLKTQAATAKDSIAKIQDALSTNLALVQKKLDDIKTDSNERLESFISASSKMGVKLNELSDQIKEMQKPVTTPTPVINVKIEPESKKPAAPEVKKEE